MGINLESLTLIKDFEGWRSNAYPDPATGGDPWTIGYGHTAAAGSPVVKKGMTITREEGEAILARDLKDYEAYVDRYVTVPLNANQRGALVSFCYNLGPANLKSSTLLKKVNAGDFAGAALEFQRWNKAAGRVMAGLTRRRAAEAALFSKSVTSGGAYVPPDVPTMEPARPKVGPVAAAIGLIAALGAALYAFAKSAGVPLP